jgi:hypothetical protein
MNHLETVQKEVLGLKPDEFLSFKTWFNQIEAEWKEQQISDLETSLPQLRPTELMHLSVTERHEILNRASVLAKLMGIDQDSEVIEWLDVALDDGFVNE